MNRPPRWTPEEDKILIENAQYGPQTLMRLLNRSYAGIIQRAHKLRLSLLPIPKQLKPIPQRVKKQVKQVVHTPFSAERLRTHPVSGLHSRLWSQRRSIVLKMHDELCVYCGDEAETVDHVIPRSKGGTDNIDNLVAACGRCNYAKSDKIYLVRFINA